MAKPKESEDTNDKRPLEMHADLQNPAGPHLDHRGPAHKPPEKPPATKRHKKHKNAP